MCARNSSGSGTPRSTSSRSGSSTATELPPGSAVALAQQQPAIRPNFGRIILRHVVFLSIPLVLLPRGSSGIFHQYEDERSNAMRGDKKVLLAAMLGATVMAAPAVSMAQARGETGWYIGGNIGQTQAKDWCSGIAGTGISCDDKDTAFKI